jgi:hypothetical protein
VVSLLRRKLSPALSARNILVGQYGEAYPFGGAAFAARFAALRLSDADKRID